jgi:hypothetical protein
MKDPHNGNRAGISIAHAIGMKRRDVLKIFFILAGALILTQCGPPTPVAAAVEFAAGVGADADLPVITELVAAFDEDELEVKKADLNALMQFSAMSYNYHGLKRSGVPRVWEEVFLRYRGISSSHVFTELKLVQTDGVRKAYVTCTGGLHGTEKQTGKPITIVIAGCVRCITSSKRKGTGDSSAMQEALPITRHRQAPPSSTFLRLTDGARRGRAAPQHIILQSDSDACKEQGWQPDHSSLYGE